MFDPRVLTGDPERVKMLVEQWSHHGWSLVSAGYDQDGGLRTAVMGKRTTTDA